MQYTGTARLLHDDDNLLHFYWDGPWKLFSPEGKYVKTEVYNKGRVQSEFTEKQLP